MYKEVKCCRICQNHKLTDILDLGVQTLTGIFPKDLSQQITAGPLAIVKCDGQDSCGLLQLKHSYSHSEMYGENYGYRSGLNKSMVAHLQEVFEQNLKFVDLSEKDIIVDIGSNDGTSLGFYPEKYTLVGIDPTSAKFKKYYRSDINIISDFFSAKLFKESFPNRKAKIVNSISMFYDLEEPLQFVKEVYEILDDKGIWTFEQSYMPLMIEHNAYDTICHEHLEYYALKQILWMFAKVGFKILDIELNDTNGGSFKVIASKKTHELPACEKTIQDLLEKEAVYDQISGFDSFVDDVVKHKNELVALIKKINAEGKKVFGYGASTKGNVILQYCEFTTADLPYIAEVNEDKFGSFTPQSNIPIISEKDAKALKPDYFLVLPWHFKNNFLEREKSFLEQGGKFIFPLPTIETVG